MFCETIYTLMWLMPFVLFAAMLPQKSDLGFPSVSASLPVKPSYSIIYDWSISLIKSGLKWCIHLSWSLFLLIVWEWTSFVYAMGFCALCNIVYLYNLKTVNNGTRYPIRIKLSILWIFKLCTCKHSSFACSLWLRLIKKKRPHNHLKINYSL